MEKSKWHYRIIVLIALGLALTFRPGLWLIHKPANTEDARYTKGWEDGCISGTNSYSLLYAPMLDKPFVKETEKPETGGVKDNYKSAWNEGFTLCRYYQSAVYELMQFTIVIATLLYIGYHIRRRP